MAVVAWGKVATQARALQARQARTRRFSALLIDLVVFSILATVVNNVYGVTQVTGGTVPNGQSGFFYYSTVTAAAWPFLVLVWLTYHILLEGLYGASIGKMLIGLCVVRVDGQPLGISSIVARNLMRLVDALPILYLIGGISVLVSGSSQRLGDIVAGTTVVRRDDAPEPWATRHPARGTNRVFAAALVLAALFTIGFDYFGRPALVIQGMVNTGQIFPGEGNAYTFSSPHFGLGTVAYTVTSSNGPKGDCNGTITMQWTWMGWQESSFSMRCEKL